LWNEVRKLREEGTTIILTTHYLDEAEELADRIGVLRRGRLIVVEDRDELMARQREHHVTIRYEGPLPETDLPSGFLRSNGRTIRAVWSTPDDLEAVLARARSIGTPVDVDVEQTTLEDIFIGLVSERGE